MKLAATLFFVALLGIGPARADEDIARQIVNSPNAGSWSIVGDPSAKTVRDNDVQGGRAVVVNVPGNGNQWEISGNNIILKKIGDGDKLAGAVWMRAKSADGQPVRVHVLIQLADQPWTPIKEADFMVGETWKLYTLEATAPRDYAPRGLSFNVLLKTGKQTVFLGPAFVLNLSRTY